MPEVNSGIMVGAIRIEGNTAIASSAFAPLIEANIGQRADTQKLKALARSVADLARKRGYIFASAVIPAQSVDTGIVTVRLDEGHVDKIRITGSTNPRLSAILDKIVRTSVQKSLVERQLLLAEDIPGIKILNTRYIREASQAVLAIEVREDHNSGSVTLDNSGPTSTGPTRLSIRYELAGLLERDDVLTLQGVVTPLQPRELTYGSLRYARSIGTSGAQLGIAGAIGSTQPGSVSGIIKGRSRYAALFAIQPLMRSSNTSIWLYNEFAYLTIDQTYNGQHAQRDTITTFTAALSGSTMLAGGQISAGLGMVQGINLFGATRNGDPLASRRDASGSFTKGQLWLNWSGPVVDHLRLRLAANGQVSSSPLPAAQELGLGGSQFGRGYDFNERFGENGVMGMAELRRQFDRPAAGIDWMQIYGFVDGGVVNNLSDGVGGGSLLSSGGGLRAAMGTVELGVEAAFPINQPRRESGTKRARLNLSVGANF